MPSVFEQQPTPSADEAANGGPARRGSPANCRTCTDFKTWSKQARSVSTLAGGSDEVGKNAGATSAVTGTLPPTTATNADNPRGCPYDKDDLGNSTWGLLHTMAAHYPDQPSPAQAKNMSSFFTLLSKFYPCEVCAKDFQHEIQVEPINASSQSALSQWLCRLHNKVNVKLGKPVFDCSYVDQRWRDGWNDGSCD